MTNTILKQASDCFYEKISQKKYAEATLRNYRQRIVKPELEIVDLSRRQSCRKNSMER